MAGSGGAATERWGGECSPITASPRVVPGATSEPCPDCSRPGRTLFHSDPSSCPFRGRYHAVPCRGASLWESAHNRHMTRNEDRICDACRKENRAVVAQLKAQPKC